jgi:hypothetical protein
LSKDQQDWEEVVDRNLEEFQQLLVDTKVETFGQAQVLLKKWQTHD